MTSAYLADLIVALHVVYVGFVVLGEVFILIGAALRWGWVRNFWFRNIHLGAIGFVALEALIGMACPLTVWEDWLRRNAGETVTEGTFIGRCLHKLIFLNCPPWFFIALHVGFALLVLATFIAIPPRRRSRPASEPM
ncbi:hypothetical protein AYO44_08155 [Planctomycetaceae bacterium SCGC AG-212-F19]|nr:hypothetical protein AYO44_08155 [Planctomycetaceae bacterium SCGC AG-212-F19]